MHKLRVLNTLLLLAVYAIGCGGRDRSGVAKMLADEFKKPDHAIIGTLDLSYVSDDEQQSDVRDKTRAAMHEDYWCLRHLQKEGLVNDPPLAGPEHEVYSKPHFVWTT